MTSSDNSDSLVISGGVPRIDAAGMIPVADLVHACHEDGIEPALQQPQFSTISRAGLEPVLTYCAEQRCIADSATCPGCRRFVQSRGLDTLNSYVAGYGEIRIEEGGLLLSGAGHEARSFNSLEALARGWAGEEYWFWARRVLRKLRYGIRARDALLSEPVAAMQTPAILLMEPQIPENIGMVARAMANFGLDDLRVIAPRDGWPSEKARAVASGASAIIDSARITPNLDHAISDLNFVVATTARQRHLSKPVLTPELAVNELHRRLADGQRVGILFGRERNGLENHEVANADAVVMIPVNSAFASLNLAQSVLILGYEWLKSTTAASLGRVTTYEQALAPGPQRRGHLPASKKEVMGLFDHLESELRREGFPASAGEAPDDGQQPAYPAEPHGAIRAGGPNAAGRHQGARTWQDAVGESALVMP